MQIKLYYFGTVTLACVLYRYREADIAVGGFLIGGKFAVFESSVRKSVTERDSGFIPLVSA